MRPDSGTLAWEPWEEGGREAHTTSGVTLGPAHATPPWAGKNGSVGTAAFCCNLITAFLFLLTLCCGLFFCFVLLFFVDFFLRERIKKYSFHE